MHTTQNAEYWKRRTALRSVLDYTLSILHHQDKVFECEEKD